MEQPVQKSGMPRGCLIALIVVGVLVVIFAALFAVCYFNKDKFVKWTIRTGVTFTQTELSKDPVGTDTVKFNALTNNFLSQLDTAHVSDEQFAKLGPVFQQIMEDKKIDTDDVYKLSDAMIVFFPNLESLRMIRPGEDMTMPGDSVVSMDSAMTDSGTLQE